MKAVIAAITIMLTVALPACADLHSGKGVAANPQAKPQPSSDAHAVESQPATTLGHHERFNAVAAACRNIAGTQAERDSMDTLLKDIAEESKRLEGQGLVPGKAFDPAVYAHLYDLLTDATNRCGIALPAAMALDSTEDDVVRQASWRFLALHEDYRVADLPVLGLVFLSSMKANEQMFTPRAWITPDSLRFRLGASIAYLCGVVDLFHEKGNLSLSSQESDPKAWLRHVLQHGITTAKDDRDRTIIAGCLLAND